MKKNMGPGDRLVRSLLAILIMVLYYFNVIEGVLGIVFLGVAGILLLTSLVRVCPLYLPFGLSTRSRK
ncbi:MAG: hypothetical protein CMB99_11850 [Flavobacteriaceae bacterium]|nr:hypothetical protein [Flavobacteriaceae bacterium]